MEAAYFIQVGHNDCDCFKKRQLELLYGNLQKF